MKEILRELAVRLASAPTETARLVLERGEVSDALHRALDAIKEREAQVAGEVAAARNGDGKPLYPNEQARLAEIQRRLQADGDYQALKAEADRLRLRVRELDARMEEVSRRHRSDCRMADLAAALLNAGMREEALAALEAYAQGLAGQGDEPAEAQAEGQGQGQPEAQANASAQGQANAETQANAQGQDNTQGLAEGTFKVLEARPGNSPGVVRAWCEGPQGQKVALYAKNGAAKALQGAVGKRVKARYRALDKGLYAVAVEVVA